MKKYILAVLIINYILALILSYIQHGKLSIDKCFPYIIFNSSSVFVLYLYESYKVICVIKKKTNILLIGSFIDAFVRVCLCLLFFKSSINIFVFAIVNLFVFFIRTIMYKVCLKYYYKILL